MLPSDNFIYRNMIFLTDKRRLIIYIQKIERHNEVSNLNIADKSFKNSY